MSEQVELTEEMKLGYRAAHHAALYAHLRWLLSRTLSKENPVIGVHAVCVLETGFTSFSAGAAPELPTMLSMIGHLQGETIRMATARLVGDRKIAQTGDEFNPATGKAHCLNCEDGDPTGDHAENERRENAKAWLGVVIAVAMEFYGPYMSEEALALLVKLTNESIPAEAKIS